MHGETIKNETVMFPTRPRLSVKHGLS